MTIDATPTQKGERELRTVLTTCGYCQGFGRLYGGHPNNPDPSDYGTCPDCQGHGEIEVDTVVVTEEEIMEPAYDPTTQPFDEPNMHVDTSQKGEREEALELLLDEFEDAVIAKAESLMVWRRRRGGERDDARQALKDFLLSSSKAEGEMREALEEIQRAYVEGDNALYMAGVARRALSPKESA